MNDRLSPRPSRAAGLARPLLLGFVGTLLVLAVVGAAASGLAQDAAGAADAAQAAATDSRVSLTGGGDTPVTQRLVSLLGLFAFIGMAWGMSNNRRRIDWRLVAVGVGLQWIFALLILKTELGAAAFAMVGGAFETLLGFTGEGSKLIFGSFVGGGQVDAALINFAFAVLPTIIFFSSLMAVLYHVGLMQLVVNAIAWAMQRSMRTSGSETLSAAGNIFVGQTEAPLLVRPFVDKMTQSELMALMTGGFATVAGGVMASYIQFLSPYFVNIAGHLMAASVMSAPAALVIAKIMFPETEESETKAGASVAVERIDANLVDAAARGASEGMTLALNVAAMLLAFVALIAALNYVIALPSYVMHGGALNDLLAAIRAAGVTLPADLATRCDVTHGANVALDARAQCIADLSAAAPGVAQVDVATVFSLQRLFGVVFWPIAWLMGIPAQDCTAVAAMLGTKMALNEFVAYLGLVDAMQGADPISQRSGLIAAYALCGFANFGSIGIQIGGIGGIAPTRRRDLATLGMRAMIAGTLAAFMTATIAGVLL